MRSSPAHHPGMSPAKKFMSGKFGLLKSAASLALAVSLFFVSFASSGAFPESPPLVIHFDQPLGPVNPRIGFLGGLRDSFPDRLVQPLHPSLWRIGHQFQGRIAGGLTGAVDRVEHLGAAYKLVMSDLIPSGHTNWVKYEADVKKLVEKMGPRSRSIIWEPVNEPDISHKPIEKYYELYAHAFKALREAEPGATICGPGFAYPSHEKYRQFLDYCREHHLECNYLAWHYTGWDPNYPEQANWGLGRLREFIAAYSEQKVREIHCDEWGAGPDKPGRLHPGRAVLWFYYLENVYQVDRACRANWGKADDFLGGIVNAQGEPFPVYHVYRLYAGTKGQTRVAVEGNSKTVACLASQGKDHREVLLGSVAKTTGSVVLKLQGLGGEKLEPELRVIPATNLDAIMPQAEFPLVRDFALEQKDGAWQLTIPTVEENQAYHLILRPAGNR